MSSSNTSDTNAMRENYLEKGEKDAMPDSSSESNDETVSEKEPEVLSGYPLSLLIFAISLAGFIYALDIAIIVTITFFIFVVIFEIGSLICGVAPSSAALVIGRAVAGIGGSGLFNGALTIIAGSLAKEKRAQTVALVYVFSMMGSIVAPIIGGVLTEKASWRWCFYINLPAGAVTLVILAFIRIPDNRPKTEKNPTLFEIINRLDPVGFILFAPTCIMVLLALQWGGSTYAWNSSTIIGLFVGSAVSLPLFLFWESRRGDTAMVPLSILRQRIVYSSCLAIMFQYGSFPIFNYYLPVWFQTILGVSPILSGAYFMATAGPLIAATVVTGVLASKLGSPALFTIIGNGIATIGCGLLTTFTPSSSTGVWIGYQVLAGVGRGMTLQQPINAVQHTLDSSKMAVGTSMVVLSQFFGGALFLALAQTDFSSSLRSALTQYAPGVDATLISQVGAAGVRGAVTSAQLPGVLMAYNQAIRNTFYLGCASSGLAFVAAWGMGLKRIKMNKKSDVPAEP
ncbi:hypothetical protein EG329_001282 [Mollisiaceae sp. DMI_Dod_QoI]|nr:hypothetical protein EG329_001282 [Helotiales sp. DMI_Dod_QoI]